MYKAFMRDDKYVNLNNESFYLIKDNVVFDKDTIKMCNYKPISKEFMKKIDVCLNSCRERINNERKYNSLINLAKKLSTPSDIKFKWNLNIYNIFDVYEEEKSLSSSKEINENIESTKRHTFNLKTNESYQIFKLQILMDLINIMKKIHWLLNLNMWLKMEYLIQMYQMM
jgi:hypothetical protein